LPLEFVDYAGFTDARLASDENDLSLPSRRYSQVTSKLTDRSVSSHEFRLPRHRGSGCSARWRIPHGCNELVSPSGQGLDEERVLSVVAQLGSEVEDVPLQNLRLDIRIGPHRLEKFVLSHQPSGTIRQIQQNRKCLGL
jgi:hypothetical protein